jgi:hypothetical protein
MQAVWSWIAKYEKYLVESMEENFLPPYLHGASVPQLLCHWSAPLYQDENGAIYHQRDNLHYQRDALLHWRDVPYHQSDFSYLIHDALCHVHYTDISQDRDHYSSKVVLSVQVQVDMETGLEQVDGVVAVNGMNY